MNRRLLAAFLAVVIVATAVGVTTMTNFGAQGLAAKQDGTTWSLQANSQSCPQTVTVTTCPVTTCPVTTCPTTCACAAVTCCNGVTACPTTSCPTACPTTCCACVCAVTCCNCKAPLAPGVCQIVGPNGNIIYVRQVLDKNGNPVYDQNGSPVFQVVNANGSPVLDSSGNPVFVDLAGNIVIRTFNPYGNPIYTAG